MKKYPKGQKRNRGIKEKKIKTNKKNPKGQKRYKRKKTIHLKSAATAKAPQLEVVSSNFLPQMQNVTEQLIQLLLRFPRSTYSHLLLFLSHDSHAHRRQCRISDRVLSEKWRWRLRNLVVASARAKRKGLSAFFFFFYALFCNFLLGFLIFWFWV